MYTFFHFFDTIEQNDAFLKMVNFADRSKGSFTEGDGLCENVCSYSKVQMEEQSAESEDYTKYLSKSMAVMKVGMS